MSSTVTSTSRWPRARAFSRSACRDDPRPVPTRRQDCARHRRPPRHRQGDGRRAGRSRRRHRRRPARTSTPGSDVEREVAALGRPFRGYACDLADRSAVYAFVASVEGECPPIDILVNNAGAVLRKPAAEHPDEYWDHILEVNLNAQFVLAREFGRACSRAGRGKIIFTASLLSFQGGHHRAGLCGGERRRGTVDQGAGQRMGRPQRPGERHRARLHRHRQHRGAARRSRAQSRHPVPHPRRPLGPPRRSRRRGSLPGVGRRPTMSAARSSP